MPKLLRKKNMLFYEERGKIGTFTFSAESKKGEQDARKRISIKIEEEN